MHGRDDLDEAQGAEGSALPDREHRASHDDRRCAVRPAAGHRRAGAPPLGWGRSAERWDVAGDHEPMRSACYIGRHLYQLPEIVTRVGFPKRRGSEFNMANAGRFVMPIALRADYDAA